jgi:hypothetical protein
VSLIEFKHDFFAGIDVGQVNDWTAISVIERIRAVPRPDVHRTVVEEARQEARATPTRLDLVHLQRIPLGTYYPKQVEIIANLLQQPILSGVTSYMDITGVGRGPFDMLKAAKVRNLHGVMITGSRGEANNSPTVGASARPSWSTGCRSRCRPDALASPRSWSWPTRWSAS